MGDGGGGRVPGAGGVFGVVVGEGICSGGGALRAPCLILTLSFLPRLWARNGGGCAMLVRRDLSGFLILHFRALSITRMSVVSFDDCLGVRRRNTGSDPLWGRERFKWERAASRDMYGWKNDGLASSCTDTLGDTRMRLAGTAVSSSSSAPDDPKGVEAGDSMSVLGTVSDIASADSGEPPDMLPRTLR